MLLPNLNLLVPVNQAGG